MAALSRRMFLMGGAGLFLPPVMYAETLAVAVRNYRVKIRNLPPSFTGFTILHVSDLHEKEFGEDNKDLLKLLGTERFDAVAITGDLVLGDTPNLNPALKLVAGLKGISAAPIYYVSGNHDWRLQRGGEFDGLLRDFGVTVLSNSSTSFSKGKERLWIAGVDDPVTGRDRLDLALQGTDGKWPRLLLSHSPHTFEEAAARGVDLVLCGHTHGGQVRLPLLGAGFVPAMGFFPRYDYGLYRAGAATLIVSGGLGESGLPIRFNIRPEVSLVTLESFPAAPSAAEDATG